ncbi:MAG TPA: bacterial transcriptional activator domain-containing protein, partial [Chloroflexota bacterium]|nr:bacterial transcriptional activator domain-containing protein [Chloroflexota bacterium]
ERRAALERAHALYQGDLLAGRRYEWLDERDGSGLTLGETYRSMHREVVLKLADLYRREGRVDLAVPLYRQLLQAEPTLEEAVRGLFRCHQERGDRGAVLREERRLREALERAYAGDDPDLCRPSVETAEVFEDVLAELSARSSRTPVNGKPAGRPAPTANGSHPTRNGAAHRSPKKDRAGVASAGAGDA